MTALPTDSCAIRSNGEEIVFVVGIEQGYDPSQGCMVMLDGPLLIISQANVELVRVEGLSERCRHEIRNASAMRLVNVKRPGRRDETISVNALLALRGE